MIRLIVTTGNYPYEVQLQAGTAYYMATHHEPQVLDYEGERFDVQPWNPLGIPFDLSEEFFASLVVLPPSPEDKPAMDTYCFLRDSGQYPCLVWDATV